MNYNKKLLMTLIIDTSGGLHNQFYNIVNGINVCLKYNILKI